MDFASYGLSWETRILPTCGCGLLCTWVPVSTRLLNAHWQQGQQTSNGELSLAPQNDLLGAVPSVQLQYSKPVQRNSIAQIHGHRLEAAPARIQRQETAGARVESTTPPPFIKNIAFPSSVRSRQIDKFVSPNCERDHSYKQHAKRNTHTQTQPKVPQQMLRHEQGRS